MDFDSIKAAAMLALVSDDSEAEAQCSCCPVGSEELDSPFDPEAS